VRYLLSRFINLSVKPEWFISHLNRLTKEKFYLTLHQQFEKNNERLPLYPVVFSRVTGVEFYRVKMDFAKDRFKPWPMIFVVSDTASDEEPSMNGYLILSRKKEKIIGTEKRIIKNCQQVGSRQQREMEIKPKKEYTNRFPHKYYVNSDGTFQILKAGSIACMFMQHKLLFDITAMMIYPARTNENTKLARLGNEGRSTATTILTYGIVKTFSDLNKPRKIQKVLSFIDNRQDAALQSGHFNDSFVVGVLRTAINAAIQKNETLEYSNISQKVFEELKFSQKEYAEQVIEGTLAKSNI